MEFSYSKKRELNRYAQRSVAMGPQGMVASSQQLATLAGYKALSGGGNAVDAAVAMVSTLNVVEPHSVGIGGDAFALIYLAKENKILGMNGSGRAPSRADMAWFRDKGITAIPERGILAVTVPGALHGWAQAVERYGSRGLTELFEDAYSERLLGDRRREVELPGLGRQQLQDGVLHALEPDQLARGIDAVLHALAQGELEGQRAQVGVPGGEA